MIHGTTYPCCRMQICPRRLTGANITLLCVHPVLNQGQCGSCWAFAASEVLSDRFCIASNGSTNVILSPGELLACEKLNLGCTMGSLPQWAFSYIKKNGVVSDACVPYTSGNGKTQKCPPNGQCTNSTAPGNNTRYYVESYNHCGSLLNPSTHVNEIMKCILDGGPVDATFNVYSDFDGYEDGVYTHKTGSYKGLHSVKVVGWGRDDASGYDYWIVQNSWGRFWGEPGRVFPHSKRRKRVRYRTLDVRCATRYSLSMPLRLPLPLHHQYY